MALHHSGAKEILSFYELERRKVFDQNKALLAVRLKSMEREIEQITLGYKPKDEIKTLTRVVSKKIELLPDEQEQQRNWHSVDPPPVILGNKYPKNSWNKHKMRKNAPHRAKVRGPQLHSLGRRKNRVLKKSFSASAPVIHEGPTGNNLSMRGSQSRDFRPKAKAYLNTFGGSGPRFPRPSLSGVMNGPNERTYNVKGFFGLHPKGEMVETFAWDEVRDADLFKGGAWNLRMLRYANERKASLAARAAAQKVKQSRRLKQQAKDELKIADQTDRRQSTRPRNWFVRDLEKAESMTFQYTKGGQIKCSVPLPKCMPKPKDGQNKMAAVERPKGYLRQARSNGVDVPQIASS